MDNYVITIARGFGSGGKQTGLALAQMLSIPCYESQILAFASEVSGINESKYRLADEKLTGSALLRRLKAAPNIDHIISPAEKGFTSDDNLFSYQAMVIRELCKSESCIIIGKAANYILRDEPNVLSVLILAPFADAAKSIRAKFGCSLEEAEKMVQKTDKYRSDYFHYYSGGLDWDDSTLYDITINTARVGRERAPQLVIEALKTKLGINL